MAILSGLVSNMKGSAGSLTFRRSSGRTIVSEKITTVKVTRTELQQRHRTKWANIVQMWKGLSNELREAFSRKLAGRSDYNMFVQVNMQRLPVYLTKQQVTGGACVAAPYQLTQGSLPAIVVTGSGQSASTDIALGSDGISASTTVAQFSRSVVTNNTDYQYGDQITYFLVKQLVNADTAIPYCQFFSCKVVLDTEDDRKLWDVVMRNGFSSQDGCLGHSGNDSDCVYAWVHSRKTNGMVKVSPQTFVNANTLLSEYTGDLAYNLAASSYGTTHDVYLSPNGGSGSDAAPSGGSGDNPGGGGGNDSL